MREPHLSRLAVCLSTARAMERQAFQCRPERRQEADGFFQIKLPDGDRPGDLHF